jgi:hypothetical protein
MDNVQKVNYWNKFWTFKLPVGDFFTIIHLVTHALMSAMIIRNIISKNLTFFTNLHAIYDLGYCKSKQCTLQAGKYSNMFSLENPCSKHGLSVEAPILL